MINDSDLILVGKVVKTHGVDGEMSMAFIDPAVTDTIDVDSCLLFRIDGLMVPFFVSSVRPRGSESLLIKLDGADTQQQASVYVGQDIYMRRADIPTDGEEEDGLYAGQLIGYRALTSDGETIGEVVDIEDYTDNPLLVVRCSDGHDAYIPIADELISGLDMEAREITFDLPEGLLEL